MSKFSVQTDRGPERVPVKQWTSLDALTHDFMDSADFRQRCLDRHGQYMSRDGRRVTR